MQASLLAEGSLCLVMPLGLLLVTPRAAKYQVPEASPLLILGERLCITLWGQSSTALSTALFFFCCKSPNCDQSQALPSPGEDGAHGSIITCLPSRDELSESFPSPKCVLLTCHEVHVLTCNLHAEEAGAMFFPVFSHLGKDISCEHKPNEEERAAAG